MRPTTWAAAVAAVLIVALQSGWEPVDVRNLGVALLVMIALIYSMRGDE